MPKISVIIRSYNEERHIGKLLTGIHSQDIKDIEVILVDSGSTDRTVSIAERRGVSIVKIPKDEFSFGRALNRGCEIATGEFLVFASAHVYPLRTDWLSKLVAPFSDDCVVLAYGRQVGGVATKFTEHQIFSSWFPQTSILRQPHNFCNNANCAIRRSAWSEQRYDEVLTGLEDVAWAKAARARGGQVSYVAEASIAHVHDETWDRVRNRYRREAMALRQIEPTIRFGFRDFVMLTISNTWSDLCAAAEKSILVREWKSIMLFRLNQFYGTWRGHVAPGEVDRALRNRFYYPPVLRDANDQPDESRRLEKDIIDYEAWGNSYTPNVQPDN